MPEDLRERLEQVSKAAPRPMHLDLKDRLSALEVGIGTEPVIKGADLIALLRDLVAAKTKEEVERLLEKARTILADSHLLEDLWVPRVDLVSAPANERTFILTKSNEATGEDDLELYEPDDVAPDWWKG